MAEDFRWKNSATWEDVPDTAQIGPATKLALKWPEAKARAGTGAPCGAFGNPDIELEYAALDEFGMAFWQARFADATVASAAFSCTCPNDRAGGAWAMFAGYLGRPVHDGKPSILGGLTVYRRVRIVIANVTATT